MSEFEAQNYLDTEHVLRKIYHCTFRTDILLHMFIHHCTFCASLHVTTGPALTLTRTPKDAVGLITIILDTLLGLVYD